MNTTISTEQELVSYLPLEKIVYNRYQPRTMMDPAQVADLAESILNIGLAQKPMARAVIETGTFELAFGHRRFEAYKLLADQDKQYKVMPVIVRDLSDEQMFDLAWDENHKRQDLNPIDEGNAYETYMREFGKMSKQAGDYFGVSEETVRGKVRLGKLPEAIKEQVRAGVINESGARSILTLTRVLPGDDNAVKEVVEYLEKGEKPEEALAWTLRSHERTKIIGVGEDGGHFSMKAKSFKYLPKLTLTDAQSLLNLNSERVIWAGQIEALYNFNKVEELDYFADEPENLEKLYKLAHLIKPPACTACAFFAQVDGTSFCAWEACFDRKKEASKQAELHKVSETTEIAVYAEADGKFTELNGWNDKHKNYFNIRGSDLRLRGDSRNYTTWNNIPSDMGVVVVGKTYEKWKKQKETSRADQGTAKASGVDYERERAVRSILEAQVELFVWESVTPVFASLLDNLKAVDFVERLYQQISCFNSDALPTSEDNQLQREKMTKPARLSQARRLVMFYLIFDMFSETRWNFYQHKTPVVKAFELVKGLATTWGVKIPKDLEKKAVEHDEAATLEIAEFDENRDAK